MFTEYFYMVWTFELAFQARGIGAALLGMVIFHYVFFRWIGSIPISLWRYDVLYGIVIALFSIIGFMFAWMLNVRSGWDIVPAEVMSMLKKQKPKAEEVKPLAVPEKEQTPEQFERNKAKAKQLWIANLWRIFASMLVSVVLFPASALPYEYGVLAGGAWGWLGWAGTGLALLISLFLFFILWSFAWPARFVNKVWRRIACPYRCGYTDMVTMDDGDMTKDAMFYSLVFYFITWIGYGLISLVASGWVATGYNSFYLAIINFAVTFLVAVLARVTWLNTPGKKLKKAKNGKTCEGCGNTRDNRGVGPYGFDERAEKPSGKTQ